MRILLFITILFVSLSSYPQKKNSYRKAKYRNIEVNTISVVDGEFYILLDNILRYESRCSYYSDTLPYGVWIRKVPVNNGDSTIFVSVTGYSDQELFLSPKSGLFGSLFYKGHDFFIKGNILISPLVVSKKKKIFKYRESYSPAEDDSWSHYNFIYIDGYFIFHNQLFDCNCK